MPANAEELTINYEENGVVIVKELDKVILSSGAWSTIIFKYRQLDRAKKTYGPVRYTIRRYRKIKGEYKQQGKFNISSSDQAVKIVDALDAWLQEENE
ncbi:hypothetical protein DRQ36_07185 [bacterium]|nr:MAG: hypothetical protein DRQ36_07185 [bacterium]